ncbi:MAG: dihydroorotase [Candidatus Omnitrophota bacterium]|jgi:dihydroorotase
MTILIKNGRLIDPGNNIDGVYDILTEGAKISRVAKKISGSADNMIDASGKIVMPGIVDMHVHLREPGREDKETIVTGTRAALKGGVTSLLAMPNTQPAIDCAENIKGLKRIIDKSAAVNVLICAAITIGRNGKELSGIARLKKEGVSAISDDGASVDDEQLMSEAMKIAAREGLLVISHCEDKALASGGVVNLGAISTMLGLRGISRESEYRRVERDLRLAKKSRARLHIAHVSCKQSVELIARAKAEGVKVTAEAAPHHLLLTEDELLGFDTNLKMNPPLRSREDRDALKEGLINGVIDVIASDHAPHTENEKAIEFERAEFGVIGLETELAATITGLLKSGSMDWPLLAAKLSLNPSKILGIDKGALGVGMDADIIVISADTEWAVEKDGFVSKSKNSAFLGKRLSGVVEYTIVNGNLAYRNPGHA